MIFEHYYVDYIILITINYISNITINYTILTCKRNKIVCKTNKKL